MALSKTNENSRGSVITLLAPDKQKQVQMGVAEEALAHILDRLTDLYPNPIEATVREVISNAYDATVILPEAEQKPVRVLIPSMLSADFIVEDFGVGMSPDLVRKVYSQYGASTKAKDFRTIGAYGLGAKAPLSYCTEFFGETTRDGVTTVFKVSRETGGNFTTILSENITGKPNGTKITIPSRAKDAHEFKAAVQVYRQYGFAVPLMVDDHKVDHTPYVEIFDDILLEETENITGRMWVNMQLLQDVFLTSLENSQVQWGFELSGWRYHVPVQKQGWDYGHGYHHRRSGELLPILVELKPGVVDFSSSRDEITRNDRSAALVKTINARIADPSFRTRMLNLYRAQSDETVHKIFISLLHSAREIDLKKARLKLGNSHYGRTKTHYISRDELISDSGFDPTEIIFGQRNPTVTGGFGIGCNNESYVHFISKDGHGFRSALEPPLAYGNAGNAKEAFEASNRKKTPIIPLALFAMQLSTARSNAPREKIIVVTDVPEGNESTAYAWRATLAKTSKFQNNFLVFARSGEHLDRDLELLGKHQYEVPKVYTFDEMKEIVKIRRKELRVPNIKTEKLDAYMMPPAKTVDELLDPNVQGVDIRTTVAAIGEQNGVIVLGYFGRDSRSGLIGAVNAGVDLLNRPIYYIGVHRQATIPATRLELVKDYEHVIAPKSFAGRSKVGKALVEKHFYFGDTLNDELMKYSEEQALTSYLGIFLGFQEHRTNFHNFLKTQDKSYADTYATVLEFERSHSNIQFTADQLVARLGEAKARPFINYRTACENMYVHNTLTKKVLESVLYRRTEMARKPIDMVLIHHLYSMILNDEGARAAAEAEAESNKDEAAQA